ncbi:MAG: hypothetical protein P4L51_24975 [Puia sp.]|nr:hypothetical protein [Puia sp.]
MEYEDGVIEPVMGAYYGTSSKTGVLFNYFREEEVLNLTRLLKHEDPEPENLVLRDNNIVAIKHTEEFKTNKLETLAEIAEKAKRTGKGKIR